MTKRVTKPVTITAKVGSKLDKKLAEYGKLTSRTRSSAVERILSDHIDYDIWFLKEVNKGIDSAKRGDSLPHDETMKEIREFIAKKKQEMRREQKKAA